MDFNTLKSDLMEKSGAVEEFPFNTVTLVIKVSGKMFALVGSNDDPLRLNLKCDPAKAEILRGEIQRDFVDIYTNQSSYGVN